MTIGELRERLQEFPDFYLVTIDDAADGIEYAEVLDIRHGDLCRVVIEADCVGARAENVGRSA